MRHFREPWVIFKVIHQAFCNNYAAVDKVTTGRERRAFPLRQSTLFTFLLSNCLKQTTISSSRNFKKKLDRKPNFSERKSVLLARNHFSVNFWSFVSWSMPDSRDSIFWPRTLCFLRTNIRKSASIFALYRNSSFQRQQPLHSLQ